MRMVSTLGLHPQLDLDQMLIVCGSSKLVIVMLCPHASYNNACYLKYCEIMQACSTLAYMQCFVDTRIYAMFCGHFMA